MGDAQKVSKSFAHLDLLVAHDAVPVLAVELPPLRHRHVQQLLLPPAGHLDAFDLEARVVAPVPRLRRPRGGLVLEDPHPRLRVAVRLLDRPQPAPQVVPAERGGGGSPRAGKQPPEPHG
eukprot:169853-Prorocentrum_minimum.AAC.1